MTLGIRLGYNTNGFAHHCIEDSIMVLEKLGYKGIGVTIDCCCLNPFSSEFKQQLRLVKGLLAKSGLYSVVETGSRFLLDPWRKHYPTLITPCAELRKKRFDFLKKSLEIAEFLGSEALSFWSGQFEEKVSTDEAFTWLVEGCKELSKLAEMMKIPLAFEPEPGMLVDNLEKFDFLARKVNSPYFTMTFDVGHIHLMENEDASTCFREYKDIVRNVHLEDMTKTRHEHLFFGEGEINFKSFFKTLKETEYSGPILVELSKHSHEAVKTAKAAFEFVNGVVERF